MVSSAPFAKISRPRLTAVFQRSRLFGLLDASREQGGATFVSNAPGSGKTTLLSSYVECRNLRCLWYQMDASDSDVATFFHYLGLAAEPFLENGSRRLPHFTPEFAFGLASFSRQYFRELYAALGTPFVLVLDNYQEVPLSSALHEVIRYACDEIPDGGHLMIASRHACPQPLARHRANGTLTVLNPDALALSSEEAQGIAALRGVHISEATAAALHQHTGGWAAGLVLSLQQAGWSGGVHVPRAEPGEAIFDYFAAEVFGLIDADQRDVLLQAALLPTMTPRTVGMLTGRQDAESLLRRLLQENCFIMRYVGEEPIFQFQPLFRQFLLDQSRKHFSPETLSTLRRQAAKTLEAAGDWDAAIALLLQEQDWEHAAGMIIAAAPGLMAQGRIATILSWINGFPAQLAQENPWLLYWLGVGKSLVNPYESKALFEAAYRRFDAAGYMVGLALSWSGMMDAIFHVYIDLHEMDPWLVEFENKIAPHIDALPPGVDTQTIFSLFQALSFRQPQHPDMPRWVERVCDIVRLHQDVALRPLFRLYLAMHHIWQGNLAEAEVIMGMFHHTEEGNLNRRPLDIITRHLGEATHALHAGLEEQCLQAISDGLAAAERYGIVLFDSILLAHGAAISLNRGALERADHFLGRVESMLEHSPFVDTSYYYGLAAWRQVYAKRHELALQLFQRASDIAEIKGAPYFTAASHLGFGLVYYLGGKTPEALYHLQQGRDIGRTIANSLIEYVYLMFAAYIAFDSREEKHAVDLLRDALQLGRERNYLHFFFFPPKVIAALCLRALDMEIETNYVKRLIERNELAPDQNWSCSESWPWPIKVYTLGRFAVLKDGCPLYSSGKAQKKPMELLKAMIAFGGRDVPESRLADALWPQAEGDAAAQALATTLFRLRRLVGNKAVVRQGGALTLDPRYCWVDCWALERLLNDESYEPKTKLDKMLRLYQSPFLHNDDNAPWAETMRERLEAKVALAREEMS